MREVNPLNEEIIESVSALSAKMGEKPTTSMRKSGVGKDFFIALRRGSYPSAEKIKKLADYFGVPTDRIFGTSANGQDAAYNEALVMVRRIMALPEDVQAQVDTYVSFQESLQKK